MLSYAAATGVEVCLLSDSPGQRFSVLEPEKERGVFRAEP